jgi:hypothetical protein
MAKTRYQKILRGGKVALSGSTLASVCSMGEGLIVDWKDRRIAIHGVYPPSVTNWTVAGQMGATWGRMLQEASRYCHSVNTT